MPKKKKPVKSNSNKPFVHKTAIVEDGVQIGDGTKIWHFALVRAGTKIGENCIIGKSVYLDADSEIGSNVKIQNHAIVYHKAIIADGVFIGPNVCFTNDKTPRAINPDGTLQTVADWETHTIKIGRGASIGAHSVILPGVTVGEFAMAGSGSVITKDVPNYGLIYGNPAVLKGFVCPCGKKLAAFEEKEGLIVGKCICGISVGIDKKVFQSLSGETKKRRIWLR